MSTPTQLPVAALAALIERERAGQPHITLLGEPMWYPDQEQALVNREIDQALAHSGMLDHHGRTKVEFLDLLPLLTTPSIEFYGWAHHNGETTAVLAAARGMLGVVAVRVGDWVTIREVNQRYLAEELVNELPEVVAGGGSPRVVRIGDLEEAAEARSQGRSYSRDITDVVSVIQRPVHGTGEFYAARRDEMNRYVKLQQPLHYADTDWGRYLNYTVGSGPEARITLAPGTPGALVAALYELVSGLSTTVR